MPIITISRGSKSGGTKLAEVLHDRLGLNVLSRETAAAETAKRFGVSPEEETRGLGAPATIFERLTHRKERYLLAMRAAVGEVFEDGNGIYHGIAGQFLFQGVCNVFKVRLVAPMDYRAKATMADTGMSRAEAERYIHEADDRRAKWARQLFDVDMNDPALYHLIVNLENMTIDSAADMIVEALKQKEYQPTPECVQEFRDFALAQKVQAELFFNSPFERDIVEVAASDGAVSLAGGKAFSASQSEISDYVSRIRGVEKVVTDHGELRSVDSALDLDTGLTTRDTKAREVMMPASSYPQVPFTATIREAIVALSASAVKLDDGFMVPPRYLLVVDEEQRLVGVVNRRQLLRGLIPQLRQEEESEAHIREMVPFASGISADLGIHWTSLFSETALEHADEPIRPVVTEVKGAVQVEDSLSGVISTMLHHGVDLIPVLDGKRVAGVVLMTNVFDIVAQYVMERGGGTTMGEETSTAKGDHDG